MSGGRSVQYSVIRCCVVLARAGTVLSRSVDIPVVWCVGTSGSGGRVN